MTRTRAGYVAEFYAALHQVPMSRSKLLSIAEHAWVDFHDVPSSQFAFDLPLAVCCNRVRAVNACYEAGIITVRDLSQSGRDSLFRISNFGEVEFSAIHDSVTIELGDHLLSRDLDDDDLILVLKHGFVCRNDLRNEVTGFPSYIRESFPRELRRRLRSIRGMSPPR